MSLELAVALATGVDAELSNPQWVEVTERLGEPTLFRLAYDTEIVGGDFPLLSDSRLDPGVELSLTAFSPAGAICLVKGPLYSHKAVLKNGGAGSLLEVRGGDSLVKMDRETKAVSWPDVTDSDAVRSILSGYGLIADVQQTAAGHFEAKHALIQRATDYRFVRSLAGKNGFGFWLTSDSLGTETAHFKVLPGNGSPQAELSINRDDASLEEVEISWDTERPTSAQALQLDLNSKTVLDGSVARSSQNLLGALDLKTITGDTRSLWLTAPGDDNGDLSSRAQGALAASQWFIKACCTTSVHRLGQVVRSRTLVKLAGLGERHSGSYLVSQVIHRITSVGHEMKIEMIRNGWEV